MVTEGLGHVPEMSSARAGILRDRWKSVGSSKLTRVQNRVETLNLRKAFGSDDDSSDITAVAKSSQAGNFVRILAMASEDDATVLWKPRGHMIWFVQDFRFDQSSKSGSFCIRSIFRGDRMRYVPSGERPH